MKLASLAAAAAVGVAVLAAPIAHAGTDEFINYLARNGEDVSGHEVQLAQIDLGLALCNMVRASGRGVYAMDSLMRNGRHSAENAAMWVVGSVNYLCPEYKHLLD